MNSAKETLDRQLGQIYDRYDFQAIIKSLFELLEKEDGQLTELESDWFHQMKTFLERK